MRIIDNQDNREVTVDLVKQDHDIALGKSTDSLKTTRDKLRDQIIASGEAKRLSDTISLSDIQSIIDFGKPISEEMGRCADEILKRQDINTLNNTTNMLIILTKIMDKVDIKEITEEVKEGIISRIFSSAQKRIDQIMSKYNSVGVEIEKVCTELRTYEIEIERSNEYLENMYDSGIKNYETLCKYTIAGEMATEELAGYIKQLEINAQNDPNVAMQLSDARQAAELLNQRVHDLRMAEAVALQSLPIIKAMQFGNYNLARKINSSFIVTIPVFKNAIAQAIIAKRQSLQAKALKTLDEKTNEMLLRNSQMAADNMRMTAQLAGSSAIKIETIQQSWQTIMDGIKDTKSINEELAKQRERDKVALENINRQFDNLRLN